MPRSDHKRLLDDLFERRAAQWELRGTNMRGSFDEAGHLEADGFTWTQEATPRQDWWPLILLAREYVDLTP
jgi:hypothetical protein